VRLILGLVIFCCVSALAQPAEVPEPAPIPVPIDAQSEPAWTGVIGQVIDAETQKPLSQATVKVVGGKRSTQTDEAGRYRLKLTPGIYDLRVFYDLYQGRRISGVEIKEKALTLNVVLSLNSNAVQDILVEARLDKRNESALLQERKKSSVVQDSLGAQEMAKTPDSNAGDAVKRVVGATLVDGKYVFLRGLGGRYAQTLLNGTLMPSPEPDEPSVPLDLFPVALLSNLNVLKTYSPELPAAFGGGSLTVDTNSFPSEFELKVRAQVGGDSLTVFQKRPNAESTLGEQLGFGVGAQRALPAAVPQDSPLSPARLGSPGVTPEQQKAAGESFLSRMTPTESTGLPSGTLGLTVGNSLKINQSLRFGYLFSAQSSRKERRQTISLQNLVIESGTPTSIENANTEIGTVSGATSALANVGLLSRNHEVSFLSLALLSSDTNALLSNGFDQQQASNVSSSRVQFTSRQLFFEQLKGFHRIATFLDSEIDWQLNFSNVNRAEPDIRDMRYLISEAGVSQVRFQPNSVERFFLSLNENSLGGTLNVSVPYRSQKLKIGGLGQLSSREADGRRFRYLARLSGADEALPIDELLIPERIGPPQRGKQNITLEETTLSYDRYETSLALYGGFGNFEWKASDELRGSVGLRVEGSTLQLKAGTPFSTGGAPVGDPVQRTTVDFVPSANVVLSPTPKINVRLGYAYTLARPTFRELSPFLFFEFVRRRNVSGNPNLVNTRIHNYDARVEYFASEDEVLSASLFGKQFEKPIERIIVGANNGVGDVGYANAPGATMLGVEIEARASLARLHQLLSAFRVGMNASLIASQISLAADSPQTNAERPLQGQSPYVGNAFLSWNKKEWGLEAGLYYNVYGPRISEVGIQGLPDIVEQPFHRLDFALTKSLPAGFQVKATAANLLNQSVRLQQAGIDVLVNPPGLQFFATLSWNFKPERKSP
jgi:outer membrane receptor protein involved in Fe transport